MTDTVVTMNDGLKIIRNIHPNMLVTDDSAVVTVTIFNGSKLSPDDENRLHQLGWTRTAGADTKYSYRTH